ncbi:MAG: cell wall hydrolase [Syntrophorhabdaceae bacterium]
MILKKPAECFLSLDEIKLLALCVYGMAAKEPVGIKLGIASVIMNRTRVHVKLGKSLKDVVLALGQFPCFQEGNLQRLGLMAIAGSWDKAFQRNKSLRECYRIAEGVINGDFPDNVSGAFHYKKSGEQDPWTQAMTLVTVIGDYEFYA